MITRAFGFTLALAAALAASPSPSGAANCVPTVLASYAEADRVFGLLVEGPDNIHAMNACHLRGALWSKGLHEKHGICTVHVLASFSLRFIHTFTRASWLPNADGAY